MAEATEYALGIDLGQVPSPTAIARGSEAAPFADCDDSPSLSTDPQLRVAQRIAATVGQLGQREGRVPSVIVLAVPEEQVVSNSRLAGLVAQHLGLEATRVGLIGATQAAQLGSAQPNVEQAACAVALGAALSGAASLQSSAWTGLLAAGAAGAVAGAVGGALIADGATVVPTASAFGPTGVPLGPTAAPGPTGVPLGPTAAPGPTGVPLGPTAAAGPVGTPLAPPAAPPASAPLGPHPPVADVPLASASSVARRSRVPVIAGAVVVVAVAVGAIAVAAAGGNDAPATAPTVAQTVAAPPSGVSVAVTAAPSPTDSAAATTVDSTALADSVPPAHFVAACVVGSWVADNGTISSEIFANLPAAISSLIVVGPSTGTVHLEIGADGSMTNAYDNWSASLSVAGGGGTVAATASGAEKGFATFADDGSYSGSTTQVDSHLQISLDGAVLFDGAPSVPLVEGSGTYTCAGDRLEFAASGNPNVSAYTRDG
jgi:hypothetical protein